MNLLPADTGKKVRFELSAGPGSHVFVAGTFNNWNPTAHTLKDNPLNRYKFGTYPVGALRSDPDGSTPIYVQNTSPGADKESNWLPAPKGQFYLIMRNFWPGSNLLNQTWRPPPVMPIMYAISFGFCTDYDGDGIADLAVYRDGGLRKSFKTGSCWG